MTFRVYDYDLWGNDNDGWEVNDVIPSNVYISIDKDDNDRDIICKLIALNVIGMSIEDVSIDGNEMEGTDEVFYITHFDKPLFELRAIEGGI